MDALIRFVVVGALTGLMIAAAVFGSTECGPKDPKGPTIGGVIKIAGC